MALAHFKNKPPLNESQKQQTGTNQRLKMALLDDSVVRLPNLDLEEVPSEVWAKGSKLKELVLSNNNIGALPSSLGNCRHLTILRLDYNAITSIPAEIGQLTELTILELQSNFINSVPIQLGACVKLQLLNLLDNPLSGSAPPDGESTFSTIYFGSPEVPDVSPSNAEKVVRACTANLLTTLRRYLETDSCPTSARKQVTSMKKSDAIARLNRALAAADVSKLRSAVSAAREAGLSGPQVETAIAAADCLEEMAHALETHDVQKMKETTREWEQLVMPAKPHGQVYQQARTALLMHSNRDSKPWRVSASPEELAAQQAKKEAAEEETRAAARELQERRLVGEQNFKAWLAAKQAEREREQQAVKEYLAWQHQMAHWATQKAQAEQQRMLERERGWPSRIVLPPPTASFNVYQQALHSPDSRQSSPALSERGSKPQSPARADPALAGLKMVEDMPAPPRMRPSTSPQRFRQHSPKRQPPRLQSACTLPNSRYASPPRAQTAHPQVHRADMMRAGLPAHVGQPAQTTTKSTPASPKARTPASTTRSPRARAAQAQAAAQQAWKATKAVKQQPDEEIPIPAGYIPPPSERPKPPARHDLAAKPGDRPHTSYQPVRQDGHNLAINYGDLGSPPPAIQENPELEELYKASDSIATSAVEPVEEGASQVSDEPAEESTLFITGGAEEEAVAQQASQAAPGAMMADEDLLAMKSIRIVGEGPDTEYDDDESHIDPEADLPPTRLTSVTSANAPQPEASTLEDASEHYSDEQDVDEGKPSDADEHASQSAADHEQAPQSASATEQASHGDQETDAACDGQPAESEAVAGEAEEDPQEPDAAEEGPQDADQPAEDADAPAEADEQDATAESEAVAGEAQEEPQESDAAEEGPQDADQPAEDADAPAEADEQDATAESEAVAGEAQEEPQEPDAAEEGSKEADEPADDAGADAPAEADELDAAAQSEAALETAQEDEEPKDPQAADETADMASEPAPEQCEESEAAEAELQEAIEPAAEVAAEATEGPAESAAEEGADDQADSAAEEATEANTGPEEQEGSAEEPDADQAGDGGAPEAPAGGPDEEAAATEADESAGEAEADGAAADKATEGSEGEAEAAATEPEAAADSEQAADVEEQEINANSETAESAAAQEEAGEAADGDEQHQMPAGGSVADEAADGAAEEQGAPTAQSEAAEEGADAAAHEAPAPEPEQAEDGVDQDADMPEGQDDLAAVHEGDAEPEGDAAAGSAAGDDGTAEVDEGQNAAGEGEAAADNAGEHADECAPVDE